MEDVNNVSTVPVGWFWYFLSSPTYGWTAASYLAGFIAYLMTSVVEFVAWFLYLSGNGWLFGWWVSQVGWWGAVVGLVFPWVFAVFQISFTTENGGLPSPASEYGNNAIFLIIVNLIMWMMNAGLHVVMAPRLLCHINSRPKIVKLCPLKRRVGMPELEY